LNIFLNASQHDAMFVIDKLVPMKQIICTKEFETNELRQIVEMFTGNFHCANINNYTTDRLHMF
jgi:hypothetical protein